MIQPCKQSILLIFSARLRSAEFSSRAGREPTFKIPINKFFRPYQSQSLQRLRKTSSVVSKMIGDMCERDGIEISEAVLVGYSSGAVLAFSLWLEGDHETMVSHNGCVLDVGDIPKNSKNKECLLIHNRDDDCFAWEERYLPTRNTLVASGYDVTTVEGSFGGHSMTPRDVAFVSTYLDLY